ncbi:MAG: hypothetical protein ACLPOO_15605 [Terriglobales bacterium]|jgi:hypothetical protein
MKFANVSKGLLLGLSLLLATSVFAANIHNNKGSLQLENSVTVSGKIVPAGDYSVKWEGTGSNVQLNILKGSTVVASTTARIVDLDQSSGSNSTVLKSNGDGSKSLSEIRFDGKKYALAIDEGSSSAEMSGSSK